MGWTVNRGTLGTNPETWLRCEYIVWQGTIGGMENEYEVQNSVILYSILESHYFRETSVLDVRVWNSDRDFLNMLPWVCECVSLKGLCSAFDRCNGALARRLGGLGIWVVKSCVLSLGSFVDRDGFLRHGATGFSSRNLVKFMWNYLPVIAMAISPVSKVVKIEENCANYHKLCEFSIGHSIPKVLYIGVVPPAGFQIYLLVSDS